MEFPTKQSYVEWRNARRHEYAFLSQKLRDLRVNLSTTQRQSSLRVNAERAAARAENRPARWKRHVVRVAADQHTKLYLRAQARAMMQARETAKAIARDSWETWRESNQP